MIIFCTDLEFEDILNTAKHTSDSECAVKLLDLLIDKNHPGWTSSFMKALKDKGTEVIVLNAILSSVAIDYCSILFVKVNLITKGIAKPHGVLLYA